MKDLNVERLRQSPLDHRDLRPCPFIRPDNAVAPPIRPIHEIFEDCDGKWMREEFVATEDLVMVLPIVCCSVN